MDLWTLWRGVRGPKSAPIEGQHELFAFFTTEPNAVVAPIHPKGMLSFSRRQKSTFGSRPMRPRRSNCSGRCNGDKRAWTVESVYRAMEERRRSDAAVVGDLFNQE
jgi:hypothetical protein